MNERTLNLCLDLNIFCAAFLADRRGASGTASQTLVQAVRVGQAGSIPVQLIISWGMLTRLRKVFEVDWNITRATTDLVIETIAAYTRLGAAGTAPSLTLGGTGLMPMRNQEDAHVLETALAGQAHLLVTGNFDDFVMTRTRILEPKRIAIIRTAAAELIVAHPFVAVRWLRQGLFPDAETVARIHGPPTAPTD